MNAPETSQKRNDVFLLSARIPANLSISVSAVTLIFAQAVCPTREKCAMRHNSKVQTSEAGCHRRSSHDWDTRGAGTVRTNPPFAAVLPRFRRKSGRCLSVIMELQVYFATGRRNAPPHQTEILFGNRVRRFLGEIVITELSEIV